MPSRTLAAPSPRAPSRANRPPARMLTGLLLLGLVSAGLHLGSPFSDSANPPAPLALSRSDFPPPASSPAAPASEPLLTNGPEDARLAAAATEIDFMVREPAAAIAKAEKIRCLALRVATLNEIFATWARHQPAAAQEQLARLVSLPQIEFAQLQSALSETPVL